ncbi:serine/threonine protein kinase [Streptomyces actinomycinicus]|uniref:Serine/threonine protein kinase n=1 Tax=Streptomyces actinomycinicus TaxID=1695166 RepID=A0A937JJ04_9ACTN|nr:SAV_2336 N-terminal domain-related protein [Streptomyces actinomycinicus]MBL1080889.1 serine/threonine protein kinase [Streptomyces actinomycinicus]
MSSEAPGSPAGRPGGPDPLARLADVLAEAGRGVRPSPLELAELLWLATHMTPDGNGADGGSAGPGGQEVPEREPAPTPTPGQPASPYPDRYRPPGPFPAAARDPETARAPGAAPAARPPARVPLHLPSPRPATAADRPHADLLAPAPPMLRHPLALQRSLRPLRRRVDAPVGHELDEQATADRIARLGAGPEWWLPVLRPARERWLRLNLVYDAGPTMPVWRPLIRELHTTLVQSGTFRTVALYRAAADGTVRGPGAHTPADGRTVMLLISDCMGPQWREGPAGTLWYATLHRWARRMPLAVVQPLPEHLWRDTALPAVPGRLAAPHPAAPAAALSFTPYGQDECTGAGGTVPLPVLEPGPRWLAHWAGLLAAAGGAEFPGAVARLGRPLPVDAEDRTDVGLLSARELVLRFRASASPEAFRLAGHLAVGRPDLPVMRLVQAAVEPDPRPQHLAEVILSGMLTAVPDGPPGSYAFRDGVRDLLLLGLPRSARHRTSELLGRIGEFIDRRAGRAAGEFRASVPSAPGGAGAPGEGDPFATVTEDSVRRLSATRDGEPPTTDEKPPVTVDRDAPPTTDQEPPTTVDRDAPAVVDREAPAVVGREVPAVVDREAPAVVGREVPAVVDRGVPAGAGAELSSGRGAPVGRPEIRFAADALSSRPEARITLEAAVHEILARGSLSPRQYEVHVRPDGYLVRTEPGAYLLPLLVAVLRELPQALTRLTDPPRLRVTFGQPPGQLSGRPPDAAADAVVVVPPALYDDFAASSAAQRAQRFRPLFGDSSPDSPPAAWYCLLGPRSPESGERDLVQGPFIAHDLHALGIPTPGRTAVVHTRPDGPLTLLDPIHPYGTRPPRPETYYSVDLTPHESRHIVSLPSSGKGAFKAAVMLSWRVADPVAFVRGEATGVPGLLLEHLCATAAPVTRRHPLRRASAAQRAVNAGVDDWPVPGLAVSYTVQLVPEWAPAPAAEPPVPSRRRLASLLAGTETVLIGFDGPLARLFPAQTAREAVLDLLAIVADHRDPQDALAGRPLPVMSAAGREAFAHPLDLLRAFAHDRLGPLLRARLDDLELAAVPDAPTTHRSPVLVRALHRAGRRVSVVTDVGTPAVHRYLVPYRLPFAGVHGRRDDLGLLTPHPDCLLRALDALGAPARTGVLVSSSVAELTAAQQLGLRVIGYAPSAAGRRTLREGGSEVTLSSLEPLLEAAHSL